MKSRMKPGTLPSTWWPNKKYSATAYGTNLLNDILGDTSTFSFPKSVYTVEDCLRAANLGRDDVCIDYFAGSGTTAHAVMNLNREDEGRRKYILVEIGEHFETVILPRVKKIAFSDSWKNGVAGADGEGMSQFVKYYELEQYEDVLRRARYGADGAPFDNPYEDTFSEYVFLRDLKMLDALEVDHEAGQVDLDLTKLYDDIDLPETLANLRGKAIARIGVDYVAFEDGERIDLENLDWQMLKPLIWW
jgi:adenine-specific DNA-methyltransferase